MREEVRERLSLYQQIVEQSKEHAYALRQSMSALPKASLEQQWFLHVFAPVTVDFVTWVLQNAVRDGCRRLYFLARDGYLFYGTAKKICKAENLDIDCRYLKVSRYALRMAEYASMKENCVEFVCARGIDITFEKMMNRAGLTKSEAEEIAEQCGYKERYCQVLTYTEIDQIKEFLRKSALFQSYVKRHSEEAYPNVMGYLRQEGLLDGTPFAVVDSGWLGTIQKSLTRLLRTENSKSTVQGYYFGLYETPAESSAADYKAFYFEQKGGLRRKAHFSNCLFELVFSSPEGMTLGYEKRGEDFYALESQKRNPNGNIILDNAVCLETYVQKFLETGTFPGGNSSARAEHLLTLLMSSPVEMEVILFGKGQFCDDILESQMQPLAAELTYREIQNLRFVRKLLIMLGIRKGVIRDSAWIEGSIVKNGTNVKCSLRHAIRYKYFVYFRKAIKKRE